MISVSLGTGVHGYRHADVAGPVMHKLVELTEKYHVNFGFVLPSVEIACRYQSTLNVIAKNIQNFNRLIMKSSD